MLSRSQERPTPWVPSPLVKADVGRAQAGDGPHHGGEGLLEKALGFDPVGVFLGQIPEDHMSDHTLQLLCDIVAQQSGKGKSAAYCEMDKKAARLSKGGPLKMRC